MSFERQLEKIRDRDELLRFIKELPDDATGIFVVSTVDDENEPYVELRGFGDAPTTHALGLAHYAVKRLERSIFADED